MSDLSTCKVVIPELGEDSSFEGLYSIDDRLRVWIDCRPENYDYNELYKLCASIDKFFTVKVSGSLGKHTGLNCFCLSHVGPITYIDENGCITKTIGPSLNDKLLEIYCNFWLEDGHVSSMADDKRWKRVGVSFPGTYCWFGLKNGETRNISIEQGNLVFGINQLSSSSISGSYITECFGYVEFELINTCSCDEALGYVTMIQCFVRFISEVTFTIEDMVLSEGTFDKTRFTLHGRYGIREEDRIPSNGKYYFMKHKLNTLDDCVIQRWVTMWNSCLSLAIMSFEQNRNASVNQKILEGIKSFDGISSFIDRETIYDKKLFSEWKKTMISVSSNNLKDLGISTDRFGCLLDNLQKKSLKQRISEVLEDYPGEYPLVNDQNRKDLIKYLCDMRNIDSHKNAIKGYEKKIDLSLPGIERIVTRMVHVFVEKKVLSDTSVNNGERILEKDSH